MIAIDWGTSSLRAFRLDGDGDGALRDQRRSAQGILACAGRFADVLRAEIDGWDDELIVMAGMIGSRQGWFERPYVDCPAGVDEIAHAMFRVPAGEFAARSLWIVPGLRTRDAHGVYDVMRGEEAQLCGLLPEFDAGRHRVLLPGTHSKRVTVADGRIADFATSMTGEVFELLRSHSLLGRLMREGEPDAGAFARGVDHAARSGDLLHHLFAARTLGLFDALRADQLPSFLSGLLIGHELNDLAADAEPVHLVGAPALLDAYALALAQRGHASRTHSEFAAALGMRTLAERRGLLAGLDGAQRA